MKIYKQIQNKTRSWKKNENLLIRRGSSLYSFRIVFISNEKLIKRNRTTNEEVRDESLHSRMGCQLFRHMCDEYPELLEECKDSIEFETEN